jgi:hypothetical protein
VPFQRQLAISDLDFGVGRAAIDAERFVVIGRQSGWSLSQAGVASSRAGFSLADRSRSRAKRNVRLRFRM